MSSAELRNKTEHTVITGTEWLYLQLAATPYTVLKIALDTIKDWIIDVVYSLFDPEHPATYYTSASYTILDDDGYLIILCDTTSSDITITLPLKANNLKRKIKIVNAKGGTYKVIISPNATDASTLSTDALSAIWLPKVGDSVEFIEDQNTGYWIITEERITSQLRLNTYAGYGSTDTKIMRFTNSVENVGNMFRENHSSGYNSNAEGLKITFNRSGFYSIMFQGMNPSAPSRRGLSLNSSLLTTAIQSITLSDILLFSYSTSDASAPVSYSGYFKKNDVVRFHTDGGVPAVTTTCFAKVTYLGQ